MLVELGVKPSVAVDDLLQQRKFEALEMTAERLKASVGELALLSDVRLADEISETVGSRTPTNGLRSVMHKWLIEKTRSDDDA